jgi:hypothetical protein
MSTLLCEQDIHRNETSRKRLVNALEKALDEARNEEVEVVIRYDNLEITWDFNCNEFFVIG